MLQVEHLPQIRTLRNAVLSTLAHPDLYVREEDETFFMTQHLGTGGVTFGVLDGQCLVAYAMLGLPSAGALDNLGRISGLAEPDCAVTAHLASCMVLPPWRGRGIQRSLLSARLAFARSLGRRICMATVSIHNHSSRHNMLRRGMYLHWVGQLGSLRRQITAVDLEFPLRLDEADHLLVPSDDWAAQRAALDAGYVGVEQIKNEGGMQLRFARRLAPAVSTSPA
jgi:GNAT superfamily N-acetyltransferase